MQIFKDVSFLPTSRQKFGYYKFGVFDADGRRMKTNPILISFDSRYPRSPKTLPERPKRRLPGLSIYAGALNAPFGHFLTEGGPNLLAAGEAIAQNPDAKVLLHTEVGEDVTKWTKSPIASFFLNYLGLDASRIVGITEPMTAEKVVFPKPSFLGKFSYAPFVIELIDKMMESVVADPPRKIYFSRVNWHIKEERVVDEPGVQARFEAAGYKAIHSQDHSFEEQLQIVKGATAIAGPQGTALHWSLYARQAKSVINLGWKSDLQRGICAARGQSYSDPRGIMPKPFSSPRTRIISERAIQKALEKVGR